MSLSPALMTVAVNPARPPFLSITLLVDTATFNLVWHTTPAQLRQLADEMEAVGTREEAA